MTDELKKTQEPAADPAGNEADLETMKENFIDGQKRLLERFADSTAVNGQPVFIDPIEDILQGNVSEDQQKIILEVVQNMLQGLQGLPDMDSIMEAVKENILRPIEDNYKRLFEKMSAEQTRELLQQIQRDQQPMQDLLNEIDELEPFINDELKKPEYKGLTLNGILHSNTIAELLQLYRDQNSDIARAIAAARKAAAKEIPQIAVRSVENYPVPLDKINSMVVFDFLRSLPPDGQISMLPIKEESDDSPVELTSYYSLTFSEDLPPEIKRRLTPFDRLICGAVDSLQKKNGDIMSISQIHRAAGNKRPPSKAQYKKIHDSIIKMNAAHATLICQQVRDHYGNQGYIDYYGSLFPMEMQRAVINGQVVEGAIHVLREELPLISVAKGRDHQIEDIPTELLDSKLSQTDANLAMEFFVLEQLLKIKSPRRKAANKILYSTLFEKMGAKTDKQKQRAKKAFFTYLDELKEKKFIISYKEETTKSTGETGITFKY